MTFIGFITLSDQPKKDIEKTIRELSGLGVQLKIITGDNKLIANCLAKQIGIREPTILTGSEMKNMSDRALLQRVISTDIFAEVEPNQKEKVVVFLKRAGNVVGFIGDGINDAQALHSADVGISVDSAVDVAKEAADIVLLNKDLNVLATGIVAGRKTFINTMKYIFMATSANFGNMFSMAGASLFLPFLPLLPKQILLMNLLTDFPEMTIATDRVEAAMLKQPRKWDIRFIRRFMIVFGLTSSVFDYLTFAVLLYFLKADVLYFRTGWFVESVVSASIVVLLIRTRYPFFKSPPGKYLFAATMITILVAVLIPFTSVGRLLGFERLPFAFYFWTGVITVLYTVSVEIIKRWFYRTMSNRLPPGNIRNELPK